MIETVAVGMVRDEGDVIEGTVLHLLGEVDRLLIADNRSIDGTRETLTRLAKEHGNVTVIDDLDPAYYQAEKMTGLAAMAASWYPADHAPWILPFDADEVWTSTTPDPIRITLDGLWRAGYTTAVADLYDHYTTALDADDPLLHPDPFRSMVWRTATPAALSKVAFRWMPGAQIHQGNHGVTLPTSMLDWAVGQLQVDHFPYRTPEQMVHKARNGAEAYALTDLPRDAGLHWRQYGEILDRHGEHALHEVFQEHFYYLSPIDGGLVYAPARYRRFDATTPCLPIDAAT